MPRKIIHTLGSCQCLCRMWRNFYGGWYLPRQIIYSLCSCQDIRRQSWQNFNYSGWYWPLETIYTSVVVKVCANKVDGTSTTVAGTCHVEQSTLSAAVKVCVYKVDGTSTTVIGTRHLEQSTISAAVKEYVSTRLAELQLRWLVRATWYNPRPW